MRSHLHLQYRLANRKEVGERDRFPGDFGKLVLLPWVRAHYPVAPKKNIVASHGNKATWKLWNL